MVPQLSGLPVAAALQPALTAPHVSGGGGYYSAANPRPRVTRRVGIGLGIRVASGNLHRGPSGVWVGV
jgi:hypothetical protein